MFVVSLDRWQASCTLFFCYESVRLRNAAVVGGAGSAAWAEWVAWVEAAFTTAATAAQKAAARPLLYGAAAMGTASAMYFSKQYLYDHLCRTFAFSHPDQQGNYPASLVVVQLPAALTAALGGVRYFPALFIPAASNMRVRDKHGNSIHIHGWHCFRAWFVNPAVAGVFGVAEHFNDKLQALGIETVKNEESREYFYATREQIGVANCEQLSKMYREAASMAPGAGAAMPDQQWKFWQGDLEGWTRLIRLGMARKVTTLCYAITVKRRDEEATVRRRDLLAVWELIGGGVAKFTPTDVIAYEFHLQFTTPEVSAARQVLKILATTKLVPGEVEGWQRELETGWEEKDMLSTLVELVHQARPSGDGFPGLDTQQPVATVRRLLTLASSRPLTSEVLIEDTTTGHATACTRCREKATKCVYGGGGADLAGGDDRGAGSADLTEGDYVELTAAALERARYACT